MIGEPLTVSHQHGLSAIERELSRLHATSIRVDGDVDERRAIRLSVMTLVAVCEDDAAADEALETVSYLSRSHPHRALIVVPTPSAPDRVEAQISLHGDERQVTGEVVRLRVGGSPALHLASVVTPLLLPDVAVYLWMVGRPPLQQALGQEAIAICERLIVDTGAYPTPLETLQRLLRETGPAGNLLVADLAWARLRTWREQLAQVFDPADMRPFVHGIENAEVVVSGDRVSAQAWLLIGWLSARLDWRGGRMPRIHAAHDAGEEAAPGHVARVRLECRSDSQRAVVIVENRGEVLVTGIDVDGSVSASRTMALGPAGSTHLVGALIEESGEDPGYRPAARRALDLAASRGDRRAP